MKPLLAIVFLVGVLAGHAAPPKEAPDRLVGHYFSPQPCSNGSDYDLNLGADGTYRMVRTFPEGVGPAMPAGERAQSEELGRWSLDGSTLTLASDARKKWRFEATVRLDAVVLVEAEAYGLRLEKPATKRSGAQPPQARDGAF
ncbi:MAG TPA: hypothetical protein VHD32_04235 [Candidatus Didemnitutus sp.]|nr:hypothetical protein [Candidatus Didemnitutus sp.]